MADPVLKSPADLPLSERRRLLETGRNPDTKLDYVSRLSGRIILFGRPEHSNVVLRYVPDKLILDPSSFALYLTTMGRATWASIEEAAATMLNDVNNELVARWIQISISGPKGLHPGIDRHDVLLEDRQPNWDNAGLLSRLEKI